MGEDNGFRTSMFFFAIIVEVIVSLFCQHFQIGISASPLSGGLPAVTSTTSPTTLWSVIAWLFTATTFQLTGSGYIWISVFFTILDFFIIWETIYLILRIFEVIGELGNYVP
jgi:hypothetical protein